MNHLYEMGMMHTHLSGGGTEPSKALQGADETFPGSRKGYNSSTQGTFPSPPTAATFILSWKHKQANSIYIFIAGSKWLLD